MTNFEKYKDEIIKIVNDGEYPGIKDGKPAVCNYLRCADCELDGSKGNCVPEFIEWLYEDDGEKQNSCDNCVHKHKSGNELPCVACSVNYSNLFKRRKKTMRYRKKPVEIEAVRWTGENLEEIKEFAKGALVHRGPAGIAIDTLEGRMRADKGDYIIKGIKGEFYPCKSDIFEMTYEKAE